MISTKSKVTLGVLIILIYIGIFALFFFWSTPLEYLQELTKNGGLIAPTAYTTLALIGIVIAPITIVPIIPVASVIFGSFLAGVYTLIGWFVGNILAFLIARKFGKPVLEKFVSLKQIERYEDYIPEKMELWWIILIRIIIPTDLLNYAFGLFSRVKLIKFAWATFLTTAFYSFLTAYAGEALLERNFTLFIILGIVFIIVFLILSWVFYRRGGVKEDIEGELEIERHG